MRTWIIVVAVAVGGLVVWARNNTFPGKLAPDFSLRTVEGRAVKLSDQRGKVVLLDFWASWCGPCRASLPHVQELSESESWADRGLVVWAVNDRESGQTVSDFLDRNQYTFTALVDEDGTTASAYGVRGIPMTVLVGRDGRVENVWVGFGGNSAEEIDDAVRKALAEAGN
jgi:peroxiredoxin